MQKAPVAPDGFIFEKGEGEGKAQTTFTWNTDCSIFENGVYSNDYKFTFRTYDDRCFNEKADTVSVEFTVKDIENKVKEFIPPNFVSPDEDEHLRNEFFGMVRLNEQTGDFKIFYRSTIVWGISVGISIYNDGGKPVFESNDRDFRWFPDKEAAGIYFYSLIFSDKEFKGSITGEPLGES